MVALLLGYAAFLNLAIIYAIHHYEAKVKDYKGSISNYKRALDIYKNNSNAERYAWLQSKNQALDSENNALQAKINGMQEELGYLRNVKNESGIQYESYMYKSNTWNDSKYEISIEL